MAMRGCVRGERKAVFDGAKGVANGYMGKRTQEKRMKAIHFVLGLALYLGLAAASLALVVSPRYPEFIQYVLYWGDDLPNWARAGLGAAGLGYVFLFLATGLARGRRKTFVTFQNENGTVSVSTDALQEYVDRLKGEFAGVAWMKTELDARRGALSVELALGVKENTRIPELCKLIQARVKEVLAEHLGTCDLSGISVEVDEIQTRKAGGESAPAGI